MPVDGWVVYFESEDHTPQDEPFQALTAELSRRGWHWKRLPEYDEPGGHKAYVAVPKEN